MHRNRAGRTQRGNILFLILLAVVLFAALSYAVTNSMRGGGNDGSSESAEAAASYLVGRANLVAQTVQRLRLTNGCAVKNIAFDGANLSTDGKTGGTLSSCNVYDASGGGLVEELIPESYLDRTLMPSGYVSAGHTATWKVDFNRGNKLGILPINGQLVLFAMYIDKPICEHLNRLSSLNAPTFSPPKTTHSLRTSYNNQVASGISGQSDGGNLGPFALNNVSTFEFGCVEGESSHINYGDLYWQPSGSYHFFYVILAQ